MSQDLYHNHENMVPKKDLPFVKNLADRKFGNRLKIIFNPTKLRESFAQNILLKLMILINKY
jgi:hypothetical protein